MTWGALFLASSLSLTIAAPAWAETPARAKASPSGSASRLDFGRLDAASLRADRCEEKAQKAYDSGKQEEILAALTEQSACLEGIILATAQEFYSPEVFGAGGPEARLADMRHSMAALLDPLYSRPRTCAPNCPPLYRVWAAEAYVTSVRALLDGMIDRLKDESPYHRP